MTDHLSDPAWPSRADRLAVEAKLSDRLAILLEHVQAGPVARTTTPERLREALSAFDFAEPVGLETAAIRAAELTAEGMVHTMHPGYFGLFNPSVMFPGVLADQITATLNPQLAVWSHAPAAVEIECHVIEAIGSLLGWRPPHVAGHFTSGGAEANHTSVLLALTRHVSGFAERGVAAVEGRPRLYVSEESHLAWLKIAHAVGVGREAVRLVPTDGAGRMNPDALRRTLAEDRAVGDRPVFLGATAGTTNAGMVDPLHELAELAEAEDLWFHVDAAWGGAALLSPRSAPALAGIERADSVTIDAHKWFAVPMGAGMLLCRDQHVLAETFRISTGYMPSSVEAAVDPYTHSMQWSRRFIGLKLFLCLSCLGWKGYRAHVDRALDLAARLRERLSEEGWRVVNDSPLAVVCFIDEGGADPAEVAAHVVGSGEAWISAARLEGRSVLRACVTSHFTEAPHVEALVNALAMARGSRECHPASDIADRRPAT